MFNLFHIQNPLQNKAKCLLPDFSNVALYEVKVKVTQSCPTLCDPMDYTVHGILQARILQWVAFPFSRGSSQPRNQTQVRSEEHTSELQSPKDLVCRLLL